MTRDRVWRAAGWFLFGLLLSLALFWAVWAVRDAMARKWLDVALDVLVVVAMAANAFSIVSTLEDK